MKEKITIILLFLLCLLGSLTFTKPIYAETVNGTLYIQLDYTDYNYETIYMPAKGTVTFSSDVTMAEIGIDTNDTMESVRLYYSDDYSVKLKKGTHKIYLFDGAGLMGDEEAIINYVVDMPDYEAEEKTPGYTYYILTPSTCGIKSYSGSDEEEKLIIPNEIDGYTVTEIGEEAFYNQDLWEIIIPNTVTKICERAFAKCDAIYTFEGNSKLKVICKRAFFKSNISSITIPKSVKTIENAAFEGCKYLYKVEFEESSKLETIGKFAFWCSKIEKITIPKSVKLINDNAFCECKYLEKLFFEENSKLEKIGYGVFKEDKNIKTLTIPKSVKIIDKYAFGGCKELSKVTFEEGSKLEYIGNSAFYLGNNIKKLTIPKNVKFIGGSAFWNNKLEKLAFEDSSKLEIIGAGAFGYNKIKKLEIPESVKMIREDAFFRCNNLTTVIFNENSKLENIGIDAFACCKKLKTIHFTSKKIKKIGKDAFWKIQEKAKMTVPKGKLAQYEILLKNSGIKNSVDIVGI